MNRIYGRQPWTIVVATAALPIACFALSALAIVVDGLLDDLGHADVAVVLGNKVERDGRPSAGLQARLDKAVELYEAGWFGRVIVSGGIGREGQDEARVMRQYLIVRGVPEDRIYVDSEGANTYLTARNASRIMAAQGMERAMVITQYFHVPRERLALERFGVSPVYSAHADIFQWRDLYSTAREVVAFYAYLLRAYES